MSLYGLNLKHYDIIPIDVEKVLIDLSEYIKEMVSYYDEEDNETYDQEDYDETVSKLRLFFADDETHKSVFNELLEFIDPYEVSSEKDGDYITYEYAFELGEVIYNYSKSAYIKDQSICDSELSSGLYQLVLKTKPKVTKEDILKKIEKYEDKIKNLRIELKNLDQ